MKNFLIFICVAFSFMLIKSCARNPVTGKRQVVLMSESQEVAMGQEADPQIIAQFGLYEDSSLQNFIQRKGREMAAISHRSSLDYHFRIVDSEVINAFAVPGGYVYFTRGIMAYFNNEAEFAGVLGHELGHITARHGVEQQRNALLGQIGLIAGIVIAPELARFADAASQGLGLLFLKFGRDAEREADRLGVEYSSKIGYDAQEMADFFTTLERKGAESGSNQLPGFLSTHPNPGDRQVTVSKLAAEWRQKLNLITPEVNRESYLRRIEGLIFGEDPKGGFRENGVFYHPTLRFQFPIPTNWSYQNSPQRVQMASQDGKAMMMLMLAQGTSLQAAANAVLEQYQLRLVESREVTVNGLPAFAMVADQTPQQGTTIRTLSYLIQYGGNIYHLIGVTTLNDFNNYVQLFTNTMQGFRQLTDASKLNKQPQRIRIKTVASAGTLAQALRNLRVPENRLEEHALLNGLVLSDTVKQGLLLKIIE